MYLLDTNHCSRIIQGNKFLIEKIYSIQEANISTSVISFGELIFMAERSQKREENRKVIEGFLSFLKIYLIDEEVATIYGVLKQSLLKQYGPKNKTERTKTKIEKIGISENDLWIASIAKRNNLTIVSSDKDFARIDEVVSLQLENWLEAM